MKKATISAKICIIFCEKVILEIRKKSMLEEGEKKKHTKNFIFLTKNKT